ncbi:MAG: glycosyltransferase family 4 protein [Phycisphaerales bacterium]|nr:glycosyltransferase family 4 protein [Phycisphaerales bacterium]
MPGAKRRILYIHHGSGTGGAPLSLCFLIRELDPGIYEPLTCCHPDEASALDCFRRFGHEPVTWRLVRFLHSAAGWWKPHVPLDYVMFSRWAREYRRSCKALAALLAETKPDLVHLNSLTLLPYAKVIKQLGTRVVVHVREPASSGSIGLRRAWLRHIARHYVDAIVYICQDNRDRLTGKDPVGRIVYNFVDFAEFDRGMDRDAARAKFNVPPDAAVILFSGGSSSGIKGVVPLLHAIAKVRDAGERLVCLMPGTKSPPPRSTGKLRSLLRGKLVDQEVEETIKTLRLESTVVRTVFSHEMPSYYAACDVVAVPFTKPHFARAVIEAGAMAKPVVASRIGGVTEVVDEGNTGLLVQPGDADQLADALLRVLRDRELANRLGEGGYAQAERMFEAKANARATVAVYDEIFNHTDKRVAAS